MEIKISVKISEKDYVEIAEELYRIATKYGWFFMTFIVIMSLIMLMDISSEIANGINFGKHKIEIIWFLLIIFWYLIVPQLRIRYYKKVYKENTNIHGFIDYSIDVEFIETMTSLSESKTSWQAILKVQELSNWFLLKPNTTSFYVLPKNQLNQSQQTWLRDKTTK